MISQTKKLLLITRGKKELGDYAKTIEEKFKQNIEDNFNIAKALATTWELLIDDQLSTEEKLILIKIFDRVLGLDILTQAKINNKKVPEKIKKLVEKRDKLRLEKKWRQADKVREKIKKIGFDIKDGKEGSVIN